MFNRRAFPLAARVGELAPWIQTMEKVPGTKVLM
jgi:hypothetical protein